MGDVYGAIQRHGGVKKLRGKVKNNRQGVSLMDSQLKYLRKLAAGSKKQGFIALANLVTIVASTNLHCMM